MNIEINAKIKIQLYCFTILCGPIHLLFSLLKWDYTRAMAKNFFLLLSFVLQNYKALIEAIA